MSELLSDQLGNYLGSSQAMPLDGEGIPPSTPAAMETEQPETPASRPPRRNLASGTENIPKVIDQLAVMVMESFERFLEKYDSIVPPLT